VRSPWGRRRNVRTTLFASYLLLIVLSTAFVTVFSYFYTKNAMTRLAINALRDISAKVVDALDAELFRMNSVSIAIASSDLVRQLVKEREAIPRDAGSAARLRAYRNTVRIVDVMQTIVGPYKPVPQVNLYDLRGEMIGAGVFSQAAPVAYGEVPWLDAVDLRSGTKLFSRPHADALLGRTFALYQDRSYISLYRTFFDESRAALGVLEVKQFADTIFRGMSSLSGKVVVFDPEGVQLYPVEGATQPTASSRLRAARDGELLTLRDPHARTTEIAMIAFSEQSSWRVAVSQEQRLLLKPVRDFTSIILLFGLLLAAAAVFIASRLASRLTVPLRRIHDAISGLDWEEVSREGTARLSSGLDELEELEAAFHGMRAKLRQSMDEALEARAHEMKSTLLALQSQMDPHFVYNMLTTIGIMSEEGMSREIAESVQNMTHLLRYISSGKAAVVTIAEEVEYARRYMACMKVRFRDSLTYTIDVPGGIMGVRVPRLIIQPIIENTIKYGLSGRPPWNVEIRGEDGGGHWAISVADNGPGFPEERLRDLGEKMSARAGPVPDPSLSISGMGLLNISTRLRIFYGDDALCSVANRPAGGAVVVIGGAHEPKTNVLGPGR
jgi:two-component system sensor histidine kinase YesM